MRPTHRLAPASCLVMATACWLGTAVAGTTLAASNAPASISPTPSWIAEGNQDYGMFGLTSGAAGDVNGDGFDDLVVGATRFDGGQSDEGKVWVYLGSALGVESDPSWSAEGNQAGAQFGASVAAAGDVNGDGFDDLVVGALGYSDGQAKEGAAFLYLGSPTGLGSTPAWTAEGNQAAANFGRSVATAGDVNGDGFDDVVVGAFMFDGTRSNEGRTFVYHGSPGGLGATAAWTADGGQAGGRFGVSVETAGDVNGDGFDDVIVGASRYTDGESSEGAAFVYEGSAGGLRPARSWLAEGNQARAMFGVAVGTAGDVNGDGFADVMVGAHRYDGGQTDEGAVWVYQGSAAGLDASPAWHVEGDQDSDRLGESIETAGDVNRDGFGDVVLAAPHYDNGRVDVGRAYLYQGSPAGLGLSPAWTAQGDQGEARFGCSVGAADLSGDGYVDLIVGSPRYDHGQSNEGRAFVFDGTPR